MGAVGPDVKIQKASARNQTYANTQVINGANTANVEKTAMDGLTAKWGHLSAEERIALRKAKVESNAQMRLERMERELNNANPELRAHFNDKHGADIPLQPNIERRAVDGTHPRDPNIKAMRAQASSKFNDARTQLEIMNDAMTRELRGLPKYDGFDGKGNPFVVGRESSGVGFGFYPNKLSPLVPLFSPKLEGWVVRFDKDLHLPYTAYPTK